MDLFTVEARLRNVDAIGGEDDVTDWVCEENCIGRERMGGSMNEEVPDWAGKEVGRSRPPGWSGLAGFD